MSESIMKKSHPSSFFTVVSSSDEVFGPAPMHKGVPVTVLQIAPMKMLKPASGAAYEVYYATVELVETKHLSKPDGIDLIKFYEQELKNN